MGENLKTRTARSVKWNGIDRFSSQILYAISGLILAILLSPEDFGMVGAVLIFQAFASLLVDSGFSYALLQRKHPTRLDYSTILWFNLGVSVIMYGVLFVSAPIIADIFHDERLIPLSRLIFVTLILNASSIVQVNHLTKQMNVRPVAIANLLSLAIGGAVGIIMAFKGFGVWAIVWQTISISGSKSLILWFTAHWTPLFRFSWRSLRSFFAIGSGMMLTSFLNSVFLNIYSLFIGNQAGMSHLGYYTQADKWSKMGIMSLSQTLTSSFLPPLSSVQDDLERFRRLAHKMNRATSYILFPFMIILAVMATPLFHTLFGTKWDFSIALFQMLLIRGIFLVLSTLYTNYLLSLGKTRKIVVLEVIRDSLALIALFVTLPYLSLSTDTNAVAGIEIMVNAQILASAISFVITLIVTCRQCHTSPWSFIHDSFPYLLITMVIAPVLLFIAAGGLSPLITVVIQSIMALALYMLINALLRSNIQSDIIAYFFKGKRQL